MIWPICTSSDLNWKIHSISAVTHYSVFTASSSVIIPHHTWTRKKSWACFNIYKKKDCISRYKDRHFKDKKTWWEQPFFYKDGIFFLFLFFDSCIFIMVNPLILFWQHFYIEDHQELKLVHGNLLLISCWTCILRPCSPRKVVKLNHSLTMYFEVPVILILQIQQFKIFQFDSLMKHYIPYVTEKDVSNACRWKLNFTRQKYQNNWTHYTVTFDTSIWYQTIVVPQNIQIN